MTGNDGLQWIELSEKHVLLNNLRAQLANVKSHGDRRLQLNGYYFPVSLASMFFFYISVKL